MKVKQAVQLLMLFSLLAAPVVAMDKSSKSITLTEPVMISGTQLEPGHYSVAWQGTGPEVTVSFKEHGKTIATAPATLVQEESRFDGAVETKTVSDNSRLLEAIRWKNKALVFNHAG